MAGGCGFFKRCGGKIAAFAADQRGSVLPFVAAIILAVIGFGTLAMDIPRFADLQTQLQSAADAFALAGAAELDGRPDAQTRVSSAINTLMASRNSSFSGKSAAAVAVQSITYYSALPATDNLAMTSGTPASAANPAHFVEVVVTPVTISTFFPATLFSGNNAMTTNAGAVAGFTQAICKDTPIFVCNGPSGGANDMLNPKVMKGKEVSLAGAPGNGFAPGNYGFVDIGCGNNTRCLEQALGKNNNGICVSLTTVSTTTGQKTAASRYFDTRFDLYLKSAKNADPTAYSPDVNVRKGYTPGCDTASAGGWGPPASTQELPLPDDSNITPPYANVMIGNGNWTGAGNVNFNTYWTTNFPKAGAPPPPPATRYAQYLNELANLVPQKSCGTSANCKTPNGEVGTPACGVGDGTANRRLLYAAVLDCTKLGGGVNTGVVPLGVVKFFLLQPTIQVAGGGFGTMLAEYVDVATLHDIVQLYR